jgi:uncharacterized protein (TIGR03000 family)
MLRRPFTLFGFAGTLILVLGLPGRALPQFTAGPATFAGRSIFVSPAPVGYPSGFWGAGFGGYSNPSLGHYPFGTGSYYPSSSYSFSPSPYRFGGRLADRYAQGDGRSPRAAVARLRVRVPAANADLWVQRVKQKKQGTVRTFVSPPLDAGRRYRYTILARWEKDGRKITRTRRVVVRAGERVTVDFRRRKGGPPP